MTRRREEGRDGPEEQYATVGWVLAALGSLGLLLGLGGRLTGTSMPMAEAESFAVTGAVLLGVGLVVRWIGRRFDHER